MKIKSLSSELVAKLKRDKAFIFGGTLEDYARFKFGKKASNASRRLRELAEEGILDKAYEIIGMPARRVVMYRYRR